MALPIPEKGVYTLILHVPKETSLRIGKLGVQRFRGGYYAYTGSALGKGASSLKGRISRHLSSNKTSFWHIDYLLIQKNVAITYVITVQTEKNLECEVNERIKKIGKVLNPNFGSTDCSQNCGSHLLYLGKKTKEKEILEIYKRIGQPNQMSVNPRSLMTKPIKHANGSFKA